VVAFDMSFDGGNINGNDLAVDREGRSSSRDGQAGSA
jgi:hypothetical protein